MKISMMNVTPPLFQEIRKTKYKVTRLPQVVLVLEDDKFVNLK
jgi:hypothetical protein